MNVVRTKDGLMIAQLKPQVVNEIMNSCRGHVTRKTFKSGRSINAFEFDADSYAGANFGLLIILKGSYIELEASS